VPAGPVAVVSADVLTPILTPSLRKALAGDRRVKRSRAIVYRRKTQGLPGKNNS
jgi:hypothetical protein